MSDTAADADGFAGLGLGQKLLDTLTELGYEEPTPVQRETIPHLLDGRDLVGQAATGTGKTVVAAAIAGLVAQRGRKAWFVVERTTLIQQTVDTFTAAGLRPGVVWADRGYRPADENVVIASVQTLASRFRSSSVRLTVA